MEGVRRVSQGRPCHRPRGIRPQEMLRLRLLTVICSQKLPMGFRWASCAAPARGVGTRDAGCSGMRTPSSLRSTTPTFRHAATTPTACPRPALGGPRGPNAAPAPQPATSAARGAPSGAGAAEQECCAHAAGGEKPRQHAIVERPRMAASHGRLAPSRPPSPPPTQCVAVGPGGAGRGAVSHGGGVARPGRSVPPGTAFSGRACLGSERGDAGTAQPRHARGPRRPTATRDGPPVKALGLGSLETPTCQGAPLPLLERGSRWLLVVPSHLMGWGPRSPPTLTHGSTITTSEGDAEAGVGYVSLCPPCRGGRAEAE